MKTPTAVLISGNGSNLQALIDAARAPDYPAEIVLVISNKSEAYGLKRAEAASIPTLTINHKTFDSREAFDDAMHQALTAHKVEIVCLAGFMRLLSAKFVQAWQGKMLNIHPSYLPAYKGAHAIADAFHAHEKTTGVTVHFVSEEMDAGEIILQERVEILPNDTLETLSERIHKVEHRIYPQALERICHPRVDGDPFAVKL
jgi:formyltetrahydrofolate-dependent phosphoribosylglycinamide formyltransferase